MGMLFAAAALINADLAAAIARLSAFLRAASAAPPIKLLIRIGFVVSLLAEKALTLWTTAMRPELERKILFNTLFTTWGIPGEASMP
jgi:hypothetical protein